MVYSVRFSLDVPALLTTTKFALSVAFLCKEYAFNGGVCSEP